jgi:hypothetical protein
VPRPEIVEEAIRATRYWGPGGGERRVEEQPRELRVRVGIPPNPIRKVVMPKANEVDFEKTTIAEAFGVNATILNTETVQAFSRWHPHLFENSYKFRDKSVNIGLEVEVENVLKIDPQLSLCFWTVHEDGSLRNRGREFKTYPMPLQYSEAALRQLFASLNEDVDFSKRTSIHVHMDMRQLSMSQVMGVLYTYAAIENLLFKFAGANRRNSIFCVPLVETDLLFNHSGKPVETFLQTLNKWQKYTALNLKPLATFGTMEFRQFPGTDNIQQILVWMDLLAHLRIFAYRYPLKHIIAQVSELNTSSAYKHLISDIFGPLSVYLDTSNLLQDMEKACYFIKNSPVVNPFNQKVCSSKEKASSFYEQTMPKAPSSEFSPQETEVIQLLINHFLPQMAGDPIERKYRQIAQNWTAIWRIANDENRALMDILRSRTHREQAPDEEANV